MGGVTLELPVSLGPARCGQGRNTAWRTRVGTPVDTRVWSLRASLAIAESAGRHKKARMMIGTEICRASPIRRADGMASAVSSTGSGSRRVGVRLWALLHAPALLGSIGGPGDVAFMEDDRRRLAARRAR